MKIGTGKEKKIGAEEKERIKKQKDEDKNDKHVYVHRFVNFVAKKKGILLLLLLLFLFVCVCKYENFQLTIAGAKVGFPGIGAPVVTRAVSTLTFSLLFEPTLNLKQKIFFCNNF